MAQARSKYLPTQAPPKNNSWSVHRLQDAGKKKAPNVNW